MNTRIFISFSVEDRKKLNAVVSALKKSAQRFQPIMIDKRANPGKPLSDKVKEGIQETPFFISILTRASYMNQWVNQELGYAVVNDRNIYPIVEKSILNDLKGFIHNQVDLPFIFEGSPLNSRKEPLSFTKCLKNLVSHLEEIKFKAAIRPRRVKQGETYTTTVRFIGCVINAFFTNHVVHLGSTWNLWHWDPRFLQDGHLETPGKLHGSVDVRSQYSFKTTDWPIGKYKIYTRAYEHPVSGERRRFILFENINNFEILK